MKSPSHYLLLGVILSVFQSGCASRPPLQTVEKVDLERYAGTWHEVGKYPNWFQRKCVVETTATYTPLENGDIQVVNRCRNASGTMDEIRGVAKVVEGSGGSKLRVNFGGPISGAYWIIALDKKEYRWAVVGHPSRQFLWLMARDATVSQELYNRMVDIAVQHGYRAERIEKSCGPSQSSPIRN